MTRPLLRRSLAALGASCLLAAAPAAAPAPNPVDAKAVELVRAMSARLASAKAFTVHGEVTWDQVMHSGRKLEFAAAVDASVRHPDGLAVAYLSDLGGKQLWYDGKRVTLLDLPHGVYAVAPAPATTSAMLAELEAKQNVSFPLADFLAEDPAARLLADVKSAFVVGPGDVGGVDCQHLAFSTSALDWEIWIDAGAEQLPRKVVITYRNAPSWPQYGAVFSDWKLERSLADGTFAADLPKDAHQVEFVAARDTRKEAP